MLSSRNSTNGFSPCIASAHRSALPVSRRLPRRLQPVRVFSDTEDISPGDFTPSYTNATKFELLKRVAGLNRGALANEASEAEIYALLEQLEDSGRNKVDINQIQGKWQLVYSSVEAFRSSPFFWAFQEGLLGGNRTLASAIFAYTDSVPGAEVGVAYQTLDLSMQRLESEVDLEVWGLPGLPGAKGTVVTSSRVEVAGPSRLAVTVESTRVANSNLLGPLLDQISVPVQRVFEQLRGSNATRVEAEVTFVDDELRITRTLPGREVFVYRRVY